MLALALTELGPPEIVGAQIAFHRAAGVDLVLVPDGWPSVDGAVLAVRAPRDRWDAVAADRGAAWIFDAGAAEFWWPRGASLSDLVHALPEGVDAVAGLERRFVAAAGCGPLLDRATRRLVPRAPAAGAPTPPAPRDRSIRRLQPRRTPARAVRGWFPVEVLCLPAADGDGRDVLEPDVPWTEDTRVRDVLRRLDAGEAPAFTRANAVDDPWFGVEVASRFEEEILGTNALLTELETRLALVEAKGLRSRAGRLAHRARPRRRR